MKTLLYSEIDLPEIPNNLLDFSFGMYSVPKYPSKGLNLIKNNKVLEPCRYTVEKISNVPLTSWLNKNLSFSSNLIRKFQIAESEKSKDTTHAVHSDINRRWALNYMIDLGGDDAWTSWYHEFDKPIYRFKVNDQPSDNGPVHYENLNKIFSVKFETRKWYLLRVDILHDVHVITGTRKSITISFVDENLPSDLSKKIKNYKEVDIKY